MSLTTSCCLIQNHWMELLLPQDVIDHVNTFRRQSNAAHDLTFAWHDGSPIIDLDSPDNDPYNSNYVPLDSNSTGNDDNNLSYVSNGDLTAAGVDYNNNANDNNNSNANDNNGNNDNDNNSNNDDNDDEHNDDEDKQEGNPEEEEDNHEEQADELEEPQEPQNQVDLELNQY